MTSRLSAALARVKQLRFCPVDGGHKQPGLCFCKRCYFALPEQMRNRLYLSAGEAKGEFSESYALAIQYLARIGLYVLRHNLSDAAQRVLRDSDLTGAWKCSKFARGRKSYV